MNTKSLNAHYFRRRNKGHKPGFNAYPLLGILLLFVTAALAYGATYLLLAA
jgi:hypothetical protein